MWAATHLSSAVFVAIPFIEQWGYIWYGGWDVRLHLAPWFFTQQYRLPHLAQSLSQFLTTPSSFWGCGDREQGQCSSSHPTEGSPIVFSTLSVVGVLGDSLVGTSAGHLSWGWTGQAHLIRLRQWRYVLYQRLSWGKVGRPQANPY